MGLMMMMLTKPLCTAGFAAGNSCAFTQPSILCKDEAPAHTVRCLHPDDDEARGVLTYQMLLGQHQQSSTLPTIGSVGTNCQTQPSTRHWPA
ncbi:hypothetical protein COO60DRAFT_76284 [Scenedesmus sp. NREL 46B-D3]|nr:hypothetical protein COO60DRAFT_76284 [Scenedesmus sp. NREL 46B-D3]